MCKEMETTRGAAECFGVQLHKGFGSRELERLHRGGDSRDGLDLQGHKVGTKAVVFEGTEGSV